MKHGECSTRLYQIWENARQRCRNKNCPNYKYYGGRGIEFYSGWDDFLKFKDWAELNGYSNNLTLERVDVNKSYCPENCKWINNFYQQSNTRKNRKVEHNGEVLHVSEWARRLNTERSDILYHLNQGKSIQDIIAFKQQPIGLRKVNKTTRMFSDNQILEIRKLSSEKSHRELAEIFGGTEQNMGRIVRGERYKYLNGRTVDEKLNKMLGI